MQKQFSDEPIIGFVMGSDSAMQWKELCLGYKVSEGDGFFWGGRFGTLDDSDAKRLSRLQSEYIRLKNLPAESRLSNVATGEKPASRCQEKGATSKRRDRSHRYLNLRRCSL